MSSAHYGEEPWRYDSISEEQFLDIADTGDILLFKASDSFGASVTRTWTDSDFDHVAMVLKFEQTPDEVFLIEATGNTGVSLNRWEFLKPHVGTGKFYEKLVHRHIEFERGDEMCDNLEILLQEAIGLYYDIGSSKLLRSKTIAKSTEDDNKLIDADRTFFCSELVAKAFKLLGVI